MRTAARALCALTLALSPLPLMAQETDAFVAPPGLARLRVGAEFSRFDSRFAPGSGTEPLTGDLLAPLTSGTFAALRPLETELNRFFAAGGGGVTADPQSLRLGTPDLEAAANVRTVPFAASLGVLPRLEVGLSVPLLREEVLFTRFGLSGGTVGLNPAPAENAARLAQLGDEWRSLGGSPLLPTGGSALGRELQRLLQVRAPGQSLSLPDSALGAAQLSPLLVGQLGVQPLESRLSPWRIGDAEVSGRFQLLNTAGPAPLPTDTTGFRYRAALTLSARLPTGSEADSVYLLSFFPDVGHSGAGVGVDGDLFFGRRLWTTLSLRYAMRGEVEVTRRVVDPREPLASSAAARAVRWSPGSELELSVAPRYRLTEAIALGAQYGLGRQGAATFRIDGGDEGAGILDVAGGLAHTAGVAVRYTTLPAYWSGARLVPLEVSLGYRATLAAPARRARASAVLLQATLFHSLFGGPVGAR